MPSEFHTIFRSRVEIDKEQYQQTALTLIHEKEINSKCKRKTQVAAVAATATEKNEKNNEQKKNINCFRFSKQRGSDKNSTHVRVNDNCY